MASYRSSDTATVSAATSVTVTKPAGLTAGDLMVAFVSESNSGGDPSTPSGWTQMATYQASSNARVTVYAKVADSADAAASDFTFSYSGSNTALEAVLYAISGTFAAANNLYAIVAEGGTEAVTDTFRSTTGITPVTASSLLIMYFRIFCTDSDNNAMSNYAIQTSNPTWTERHDIQDAGASNIIRIGTATATRTETTATGYFQAEVSTGAITENASIGILLAISDTANAIPTLSAVSLVGTVPSMTPTANADVPAPTVISLAASVPSVTPTTAAPTWVNTDKPSAPTINNTDKP